MDHIAGQHGRFLTVLPRSRTEDAHFRSLLAAGHDPGWEQISRHPGRRKGDPDEIWWAAPAPACSTEGYRIVWLRSSTSMWMALVNNRYVCAEQAASSLAGRLLRFSR